MTKSILFAAALPIVAFAALAQAAPGLAIGGVVFGPADIASAEAGIDPAADVPVVTVRFTAVGTAKFHALQKGKVGQKLLITIDGKTISEPTLNEEIQGSTVQISGGIDADEAAAIARQIAPPQP